MIREMLELKGMAEDEARATQVENNSVRSEEGNKSSSVDFGDSGEDSMLVRCTQAAETVNKRDEQVRKSSDAVVSADPFACDGGGEDSFDLLMSQVDESTLRPGSQHGKGKENSSESAADVSFKRFFSSGDKGSQGNSGGSAATTINATSSKPKGSSSFGRHCTSPAVAGARARAPQPLLPGGRALLDKRAPVPKCSLAEIERKKAEAIKRRNMKRKQK